MLVDHTDPLFNGVQGIEDLYLFPVHIHFSGLGRFQSEQYLHQRRFSGAVFTHKSQDLALMKPERDVFVGHKTIVIDFGNVFHSKYFLGHTHLPPIWDQQDRTDNPADQKSISFQLWSHGIQKLLVLCLVGKIIIGFYSDLAGKDLLLSLSHLVTDLLGNVLLEEFIVHITNGFFL